MTDAGVLLRRRALLARWMGADGLTPRLGTEPRILRVSVVGARRRDLLLEVMGRGEAGANDERLPLRVPFVGMKP